MAFKKTNQIKPGKAVSRARRKVKSGEFIPAVHRDRYGNHVAHVHKLGSNGIRAQSVAKVIVDAQGRKVERKDH